MRLWNDTTRLLVCAGFHLVEWTGSSQASEPLSAPPAALAESAPAEVSRTGESFESVGGEARATPIDEGARAKGISPPRTSEPRDQEKRRGRSIAVVIGINQYDDPAFPPLRYPLSDARRVGETLLDPQHGHFDKADLLIEPIETRHRAIRESIRDLASSLDPDDTVVIYFSGHGTLELSDEPRASAPREPRARLYLVATDTRLDRLSTTGIDVETLLTDVSQLPCQRHVVILDCCFNGNGKSMLTEETRARIQQYPPLMTRVGEDLDRFFSVMMASTPGGVALELDDIRQSAFTYYVLAALTNHMGDADLNEDGAVSAYEAHDFARAAVMQHTLGRQVPEALFLITGREDVILSGEESPTALRFARLHSYGRSYKGSVKIDGRTKGSLPGTLIVEPGKHQVSLLDEGGGVRVRGSFTFRDGEHLTLRELEDDLKGYRRFTGIEVSPGVVWGESSAVAGLLHRGARLGAGPGVGLTSGYRVRAGLFRGVVLALHVGWRPSAPMTDLGPDDGSNGNEAAPVELRSLVDLHAQMMIRRARGPLQWAVGVRGGVSYLLPSVAPWSDEAESQSVSGVGDPYDSGWVSFPVGPALWQGWAITPRLLFTVRESLLFAAGDYRHSPGWAPGFQFAVSAGLELGF